MEELGDLEVKWIKKEIQILLFRLGRLPAFTRALLQCQLTQTLLEDPLEVLTPRGPLRFTAMGRHGVGRATNLLTKQPATIKWIDTFEPGSVFWDVGANIGVYSLYAALRADTRVVAIEPAAVNYFALTMNCEINRCGQVTCLLAGLGRGSRIADLAVSQFAPAKSFGFSDKKGRVFEGRQAAMILPMDRLVDEYGLPCPNYVKIDVPGLTDEILAGAAATLRRREVRQVHIEANETSRAGRRVFETLHHYGFTPLATDLHGAADVTFTRAR